MFKSKLNIYNLIIIVASFIITIAVYNKLPEMMPLHWNSVGEIDNYGPRIFGAFILPITMLLILVGMTYLPNIDPKKSNYNKFSSSYNIVKSAMLTFFFLIQIVIILVAIGYEVSISKVLPAMGGVLFIVMGNYLPKAKSNYFYGIKTPWTLSSEVSWKKTHRLGGKLFVLAGLTIIISSIIFSSEVQSIIFLVAVSIAAIVPTIASYFYSKEI